jgi:hypothetical protein
METKRECAEYLAEIGKALTEEIGAEEPIVRTENDVHSYFKKMVFYIHVQTYPAFSTPESATLAAFLATESNDSHSAQIGWLLPQSDYKWSDVKKVSKELVASLWKQYPILVGEKK